MPSAVRCKELVKRYDGPRTLRGGGRGASAHEVVAVAGLDLEVERGECFGLLGPNGAGKTTTVEILEGLMAPTSGEVELLGKRWARDAQWLREHLGVSLQETHLPPKLTVRETLAMFRSFYSAGRAVDETLAMVALEDKRHARYETLSGGQKQRLAVACALVGDPDILFLDEPTTGLDPQSRRMLWDVVVAFRASGGTVLLTTHYMDEAERLCDRVGVMDKGKMITAGSPRDLVASLGGEQVLELTVRGDLPLDALEALAGVRSAIARAPGYVLAVDHLHVAVPAVVAELQKRDVPLVHLSTHAATLEDVFVHLTGRHLRE